MRACREAVRQWGIASIFWILMTGVAHADTVTYLHTDGLGTPVMESNAAGQVTYSREHRPYGAQVLGTPKQGAGFAGHQVDVDSGLVYMQARFMDPEAARFISVDPLLSDPRAGENFNRFWYGNNNPLTHMDPDGLQACSDSCMKMRNASDRTGGGLQGALIRVQTFTAADIAFVTTTRTSTPSGGSKEEYEPTTPGSSEEGANRDKVGSANVDMVVNALNALGAKIAYRGSYNEISVYNGMRAGIEMNPGTVGDATYAAKASFEDQMILVNPQQFFSMGSLRQSNRVAHEFRHLMPENNAMARTTTLPDTNPHWNSDYERDARQYAVDLFGVDSR